MASTQQISEHDAIRNTIARIAIAMDTKALDDLAKYFTSDSIINYPGSFGTMHGVAIFRERLGNAVGHLKTQHALLTQVIDVTGPNTATAVTYCAAKHWLDDKVLFVEGRYDDVLVKTGREGSADWVIEKRIASDMGVPRGDFSIINMDA